MRQCGNDPAISVADLGSEWEQPTDIVRLGRVLVLSFSIQTPITDEPWTILPFAQVTGGSGVSVHIDTQMQFADGTSTDQGTFIIP